MWPRIGWYSEAVRWAASEGVASGYGNGLFEPENNITRELLAAMLWACGAGVINGAGDGSTLTPQDQSTRV